MSDKFQWRITEDEHRDRIDCGSCLSDAPTTPCGDGRYLCRFCYFTMAGTYTAPTNSVRPDSDFVGLRREIWKAAASVFNMLDNHPNQPRRKI